jgi:pyruvate kinase
MLSGETTVGKYPLKCIEVFEKIATRIERSGSAQFHDLAELTNPRQKLVKSAVVMANELKAAAILAFTRHGHMATYASWMRPRYSPVYALCDNEKTANELALCWGVTAFVTEFDFIQPQNTIENSLKNLKEQGRLKQGDTVVIIGAISVGTEIVDAVQMRTV